MFAYRIHTFGGPDVFEREKIDVPEPASHEVLIRVRTQLAPIRSI
jgi:NADPH:quinone reductase-like Zn-dependent oxidoreductase